MSTKITSQTNILSNCQYFGFYCFPLIAKKALNVIQIANTNVFEFLNYFLSFDLQHRSVVDENNFYR